jgi:NarL family two-component system sensor histidine kinase LiaS
MRIVQEVLTNALRHARAQSFRAQLEFESSELRLRMDDDGLGFDAARKHDGLGLIGIEERVAEMAGTMKLRTRPGAGVSLSIVLPLVDGGWSAKP